MIEAHTPTVETADISTELARSDNPVWAEESWRRLSGDTQQQLVEAINATFEKSAGFIGEWMASSDRSMYTDTDTDRIDEPLATILDDTSVPAGQTQRLASWVRIAAVNATH